MHAMLHKPCEIPTPAQMPNICLQLHEQVPCRKTAKETSSYTPKANQSHQILGPISLIILSTSILDPLISHLKSIRIPDSLKSTFSNFQLSIIKSLIIVVFSHRLLRIKCIQQRKFTQPVYNFDGVDRC